MCSKSGVCVYYRVFFFFFKHKTAYEMRISDWSSDVCSSDLAEAEQSLGSLDTVDGWRERVVQGRKVSIRAFPPRIVHILAGNAPIVPPITIVRGAITKGVHLMKMPSNDMLDRKSTRLNSSH